MKHIKLFEEFVNENLKTANPNDIITIELDMSYDDSNREELNAVKATWKKFNLKVKEIKGGLETEHMVTGKKKDILSYLKSEFYEMDDIDIKEFYPELLEATSDTILYKVYIKPEYSREDDKNNTPIDPIFVQMNTGERTKISNYAAIDKIGGYGKTTPDRLLAKDRLNSTEMAFSELFNLIKTLHKVKIHK